MTKAELKQMIRECLQEELAKHSLSEGGAMSGGYAQGGALDTYARPGGSIGGLHRTDFLAGKKTKQVRAKDLKPGMITNTGKILSVKDIGWLWGEPCVEINYGGIGRQGSHVSETPNKDKLIDVLDEEPSEGESVVEDTNNDDVINEAATGFRLSSSTLLSIEDLADAVYRDTDPDAIKKYASDKAIQDVTAEDLAIAADNSDYPREVKYLAAHMKNKGVATIGEFAAKLNNTRTDEALDEVENFDFDNVFEALGSLYETDL